MISSPAEVPIASVVFIAARRAWDANSRSEMKPTKIKMAPAKLVAPVLYLIA